MNTKAKKVAKTAVVEEPVLLASGSAAASSSTPQPVPKAKSLMEAKPVRKARAKKSSSSGSAPLTAAQRAWLKETASSAQGFVWSQKIADLKFLLAKHSLDSPNITTQDQAVQVLYDHYMIGHEPAAEQHDPVEPDDEVESDTSEEPSEGDVVNVVGEVLGINGGGKKATGSDKQSGAGAWSSGDDVDNLKGTKEWTAEALKIEKAELAAKRDLEKGLKAKKATVTDDMKDLAQGLKSKKEALTAKRSEMEDLKALNKDTVAAKKAVKKGTAEYVDLQATKQWTSEALKSEKAELAAQRNIGKGLKSDIAELKARKAAVTEDQKEMAKDLMAKKTDIQDLKAVNKEASSALKRCSPGRRCRPRRST